MVGGPQLIIILVVVLLLFGGKKLPELARSLGTAKKEFESGIAEGDAADGSGAPAVPPASSGEATPGPAASADAPAPAPKPADEA